MTTTAVRPLQARVADTARADRILLALVAAHVLVKVVVFLRIAHGPLVGDETAYVNAGKALSNVVRDWGSLTTPDWNEAGRNVVGSGWFMPGMALLLTPLYLVAPHADGEVLRCYLGVVSSLIFLATVLRVRRVLGSTYAGAVLVVPGLIPVWAAFSMSAWGDLLAGVLILLLVVELVELSRDLRLGRAPSLWHGVRLGLLAVTTVYLRSSTALLVVGLGSVSLLAALAALRGSQRRRAVLSAAAAALAFSALLLPWSVAASKTLGDRVVTTTSVPTVLANTFGDRDQVCFGPCDPGSTVWFSPLRYSRETARATGRSEMDVAEQMSAYARHDVTPGSYASDVLVNLRSYVRDPGRFYGYLRPDPEREGALDVVIDGATRATVWAAFAVGAWLLLVVVRRPREDQVLGILLKLSAAALLTQPFVHIAGPRYWPTLAPVLGLATALLIRQQLPRLAPGRLRQVAVAAPGDDEAGPLGRWLTGLQILLSASVCLVVTVVVVLAATG